MVLKELIRRLFSIDRPVTNLFPAKYMPVSIAEFLGKVESGEAEMNSPVDTPSGFRGKLQYDRETCIGCGQCVSVCPSKAIKFKEDEEKIKIYVTRCTFCALCTDICPVNCLEMDEDGFLIAAGDKFSENLVVED